MNADDIQVLDDFFLLSGLLDDDVDLICDFIAEKIPQNQRRYKRSIIKKFIECCRYKKIREEIDYLLDLSMTEYKTFKHYKMISRLTEQNKTVQTTMFDFM
jgi:hypothetical protein